MIPSPWAGVVLALAVFRLVRLIGWDDLPPVAAARGWLTGEEWKVSTAAEPIGSLPGVAVSYRRPVLAHFLGCAFCQGFWVGLAVYGAWLAAPRPTLYAMAPLALSATVGLIAKNLDP